MTPESAARGPVRTSERAIAPDMARGFMLLLICVANTPWYLWGRDYSVHTIHPTDGSTLDRITQFVIITTVDGRIYPMFAFLFGYGMVQIMLRQQAAGTSDRAVVALLQRRNLWLIAFGFAHALLLFMGDVLGAYGLAGLLLVWLFLRRSNTVLLLWAGVGACVLLLVAMAGLLGTFLAGGSDQWTETFNFYAFATESMGDADPLSAALHRIAVWPVIVAVQGLLSLVVPIAILLAFWAARRRVLEEPERHLPLLRRTAALGIGIAWLGGLPLAAYHTGVVAMPEAAGSALSALAPITGLAGGVGYAAVFGLIGHRMRRRGRGPGVVATGVIAVGKRSLSCYLAQSVLCAPILSAWGLGLGQTLHSASMFAFALGVWLLTLLGAYALERAGRRGPAEALLRRLVYPQAAGATGTAGERAR